MRKYSRLVELKLKVADEFAVKIQPYLTWLGSALLVIGALIIVSGINNVMKEEKRIVQMLETKTVTDTIYIEKKIFVNECDTVYIIDGKQFKNID